MANPAFQVTNVGLSYVNAVPGGPEIKLTKFRIGDAVGYTPDETDTALHGSVLYTGVPAAMNRISDNTLDVIIHMPANVGPFNFGEIGLYLPDDTLFALAAYDLYQEKVKSTSHGFATVWIAHCLIQLQQIDGVFMLDDSSGTRVPEVPDTSYVTGPILMMNSPNVLIVHEDTPARAATMLYRDGDYSWQPLDYKYHSTNLVTSATLTTVESPVFGNFTGYATKSLLFQDEYGNVRLIDSIAGNVATLTYPNTALPPGSEFRLFEFSTSLNHVLVEQDNGFDGTVDQTGTNAIITLSTTVATGKIIKAVGGALVPAVQGTDYIKASNLSVATDNGFAGTVSGSGVFNLSTTVANNKMLKAYDGAIVPAIQGVDYDVGGGGSFHEAAVWTDLSGQRSVGVTYTNNTGYFIAVAARYASGPGATYNDYSFKIDGVVISYFKYWGTTGGGFDSVLVPPGSTYMIETSNINLYWYELRPPPGPEQIFTTPGTFSVKVQAGWTLLTIPKMIAGGGGGGGGYNGGGYGGNASDGGGSGGIRTGQSMAVTPGQTITVIIGAGGTGKTANAGKGYDGGTTSVGAISVTGGGGGGGWTGGSYFGTMGTAGSPGGEAGGPQTGGPWGPLHYTIYGGYGGAVDGAVRANSEQNGASYGCGGGGGNRAGEYGVFGSGKGGNGKGGYAHLIFS